MKTLFASVMMLGIGGCLFAQPNPDTLWTRTYGGGSNDRASSIQQTTDSGYVVAGTTFSFGAGNAAFYVVKTDGQGNPQWTRTYRESSGYANSIQQTTDGGYVVAGQTYGAGSADAHVVKTNGQGDTLWTRTYGGSGQDWASSIQQTTDGGYVIAGYTDSFGAGYYDFYVLKTDPNGDTLWTRTYGGPIYDFAYSIQQTSDGGYVIAGITYSYARQYDFYVVKTNSSGDTLWTRTYGGIYEDEANSIQQTTDGGYIIAGYAYSGSPGYPSFYVVKTDGQGNPQWTRTYGGSGQDWASSIQQTTDGGYVIAGYTDSFGAGYYDFYVLKTDPNGDTLWTRTYGGSGDDRAISIAQTMDGGYVVAGLTTSFGAGNEDFYVVKTGPEPIVCPPTELPFIDNFDSPALDSCWFWIREDTSHWSLTERPGWMRIWTQGGYIGFGSDENLLLRNRPDGSFRLETKLVALPYADYHSTSLIVYADDGNWVSIANDFSGLQRIASQAWASGNMIANSAVPYTDSLVFLRIDVIDSLVAVYWSEDSTAWSLLRRSAVPWVLAPNVRVGIQTENGPWQGETAPSISADFDYFRVDSLPGTNVCGNVSGVWDSTGSPYYVTCDVTVPAGQTLEIRPGVQVLFTGHYKFNVYGNLQAIGTEQDSIVFTRAFPTEESKWDGIRLNAGSDSSRISYCVIEYGRKDGTWWPPEPNTSGGALSFISTSPSINHTHLRNNTVGTCGGAVFCDGHSSPKFSQCLIEGNSSVSHGGGLWVSTGSLTMDDCEISSNHSTTDHGGGFGFDVGTVGTLRRCLITSNQCTNSGGGVFLSIGATVIIDHCTVTGNAAGNGGGGIGCYGGTPTTGNSIIWGNIGNDQACGSVVYSDIQGGYSGTGNIDADPMFVDTATGDFQLLWNSPCIDSGDPSSPLDPDSTRADMGAFPYFHPCLMIDPDSLEYGLLDLGMDSTMQIVLRNPTSVPIPVTGVFCTLPDFTFDTAGLGGQVPPFITYHLNVTFAPSTAGAYTDTLVIAVQQLCDTLIRIPLHGEADVILPVVDSLVIQKGPLNGIQLDWAAVTHSVSGQLVENVAYIVYGSTTVDGPFVPFGYATTNTYVHSYILNAQATYFYRVTAVPSEALTASQKGTLFNGTVVRSSARQ